MERARGKKCLIKLARDFSAHIEGVLFPFKKHHNEVSSKSNRASEPFEIRLKPDRAQLKNDTGELSLNQTRFPRVIAVMFL